MTDEVRALIGRHTKGIAYSTDRLLEWCRREHILVDLDLYLFDNETPYHCQLRRFQNEHRRRRLTLGWGYGETPTDAIAQAIANAFYQDRLCPRCFGYGQRTGDGRCWLCHGTGLAS